jgi:hypothetical protein
MEEIRSQYRIVVTSLNGRDHSEDLVADGRIDGSYGNRIWSGFIWHRIVTVGGLNTEINLRVP